MKTLRLIPVCVLLVSPLASASIIGLLWSSAGSNVTIHGTKSASGAAAILVNVPQPLDCAINLYRHPEAAKGSAFDANYILKEEEDGSATLTFGLWYDRECFLSHKSAAGGPLDRVIDLEQEIFAK